MNAHSHSLAQTRPVLRFLIPAAIAWFGWSLLGSQTFAQESIFAAGSKPVELIKTGAKEGPAWHPAHGLFSSGTEGITLTSPSETAKLFLPDAGTNGLLIDNAGSLLMCRQQFRNVGRLDLNTGKLTVLTKDYQGKQYNTPNDITTDSKGRIYFSDPRYGDRQSMEMIDADGRAIEGVYRIDLDGTVTRIITHQVDRPNGVLVSPDDKYLYVADNHNNTVGGARKLFRFDLDAQGNPIADSQRLIFDWHSGRGPDGLTIDTLGRLYVAGGRNVAKPPFETADQFLGGVYVLSPAGKLLQFLPINRDEVTNCTFGGDDLKTLYITAGGSLWSIRTHAPGVKPSGQ